MVEEVRVAIQIERKVDLAARQTVKAREEVLRVLHGGDLPTAPLENKPCGVRGPEWADAQRLVLGAALR